MNNRFAALAMALGLSAGACGGDAPAGGGSVDADATKDASATQDAVVDAGPTPDAATDAADSAAPDTRGDAGAADGEAGDADAAEDTGPAAPLASRTFDAPAPWADPIAEYLAAGHAHVGGWAFMRAIHDLTVWQDRLYLGYGDADKNLGRVIPIEIKMFADADSSVAEAEAATDEEQVDQYRVIGDALYVAGVDATEDAWLGNVYVRHEGAPWVKHRTVDGGVHVHDVAGFDGALWAVGSGSAPDEWNAGDVYAHLWRSDDDGATFAIVDRWHNLGEGDARFTRLLALGDALWVFGYRFGGDGKLADTLNGTLSTDHVAPLANDHPLRWVFVLQTWAFGERGLVAGVHVSGEVRHGAFLVGTDGGVTAIAGLSDVTVIDAAPSLETGETVLLVRDGSAYGAPAEGAMLRVLATSDFDGFHELLALPGEPAIASIAAWRGGLYFGTSEGYVLRAE